jgi:hypothetical protein
LFTGAVLAVGIAIAGMSDIRSAAAVEAAPHFLPPQTLINRDESPLSEADARVGDREQLKRYFLQDRHDWLRR